MKIAKRFRYMVEEEIGLRRLRGYLWAAAVLLRQLRFLRLTHLFANQLWRNLQWSFIFRRQRNFRSFPRLSIAQQPLLGHTLARRILLSRRVLLARGARVASGFVLVHPHSIEVDASSLCATFSSAGVLQFMNCW